MKIGLSYSRCIRDIVNGDVDINDVLVLITRTDFDPRDDKQWKSIWTGYGAGSNGNPLRGIFSGSNPEWAEYEDEDEDRLRSVSIELYESGRMFQPRQFGAHPRRMPYIWLETVLPNSELDSNPAVKKAYENFLTIAGLSGIQLDKEAQ